MEENKKIKISLKTAIIIISIIAILIIGIILIIKFTAKENIIVEDKSSSSSLNTTVVDKREDDEIYIYNEEIKSITIKYYEGYNIATGDIISDTIPLNTINLQDDDLNEVSKLIKILTKFKYSKDDEIYGHIHYDYMVDNYKLEINDNFIIYIGNEYGVVDGTNDYFKVSEELFNKISEIVQNYNEENLYKKINSEKITIISKEEKLEVTDEEELNKLSNYRILCNKCYRR